jgi:DnaJ-class molecular chaperone
MANVRICPTCNGSGRIEYDDDVAICPECHGSGLTDDVEELPVVREPD